MSSKRKKIIAAVTAFCALAAVAVFAYLTSKDNTENRIKIGYNETKIEEDFTPFTMKEGINIYKKKVQVENTGNTPCFVRLYVDFSDDEIRKNSFLAYTDDEDTETRIDGLMSNGHAIFEWKESEEEGVEGGYVNADKEKTKLSDFDLDFYSALHKLSITHGEYESLSTLKATTLYDKMSALKIGNSEIDTKTYAKAVNVSSEIAPDWVYIAEDDASDGELGGYYYYTKPLKAGGMTPPLFSYVTTVMGNDIKAFDIQVYCESVQTVKSDGEDQSEKDDGYKAMWKDFLSSVTP